MEAVRRIETLSRGHPLAWDEAGASKRRTRSETRPSARRIYRAFYDELEIAWRRVLEDTSRLQYPCPDLALILTEAQMLRHTWDSRCAFLPARLPG